MWRSCSRRRPAACVALAAALLPACATLTVSEEKELGDDLARDMRRELDFLRDPTVNRYVAEIGEDILRAAGPQPFDYHFSVIESDDINAFAAPAGHVYIHTETILKARNVSELAGVMAHEVGHVVHRHVAENYNRARNTDLLYQAGVVATSILAGGAAGSLAQLGGGLAAMAFINSFTREAEVEADSFAVEIMPRAGYHPQGLVTFFETLRNQGGPNVPAFLSSHPATEDRIAHTSALIAELSSTSDLRVDDDGKLEIIQRRIRLLMGKELP